MTEKEFNTKLKELLEAYTKDNLVMIEQIKVCYSVSMDGSSSILSFEKETTGYPSA